MFISVLLLIQHFAFCDSSKLEAIWLSKKKNSEKTDRKHKEKNRKAGKETKVNYKAGNDFIYSNLWQRIWVGDEELERGKRWSIVLFSKSK